MQCAKKDTICRPCLWCKFILCNPDSENSDIINWSILSPMFVMQIYLAQSWFGKNVVINWSILSAMFAIQNYLAQFWFRKYLSFLLPMFMMQNYLAQSWFRINVVINWSILSTIIVIQNYLVQSWFRKYWSILSPIFAVQNYLAQFWFRNYKRELWCGNAKIGSERKCNAKKRYIYCWCLWYEFISSNSDSEIIDANYDVEMRKLVRNENAMRRERYNLSAMFAVQIYLAQSWFRKC